MHENQLYIPVIVHKRAKQEDFTGPYIQLFPVMTIHCLNSTFGLSLAAALAAPQPGSAPCCEAF